MNTRAYLKESFLHSPCNEEYGFHVCVGSDLFKSFFVLIFFRKISFFIKIRFATCKCKICYPTPCIKSPNRTSTKITAGYGKRFVSCVTIPFPSTTCNCTSFFTISAGNWTLQRKQISFVNLWYFLSELGERLLARKPDWPEIFIFSCLRNKFQPVYLGGRSSQYYSSGKFSFSLWEELCAIFQVGEDVLWY